MGRLTNREKIYTFIMGLSDDELTNLLVNGLECNCNICPVKKSCDSDNNKFYCDAIISNYLSENTSHDN